MNLMQRLLAYLICGALLVCVTGCGDSSDDELHTLPDEVQNKYLGF